jgi:hypothetical protein
MRWAGHVAHLRERRGIYKFLVWKDQEKRPLEKPRHSWEDNVKMDF